MISTSDFEKGLIIKFNGEPWQIVAYQFLKPGKGGAFMQTTLKNVFTGKLLEKSFRSGERFEEVELAYRKALYLYSDKKNSVFLTEDNQRISLPKDKLIDKIVLDEYRKKENEKNNKEAIDNILNKINKKSE